MEERYSCESSWLSQIVCGILLLDVLLEVSAIPFAKRRASYCSVILPLEMSNCARRSLEQEIKASHIRVKKKISINQRRCWPKYMSDLTFMDPCIVI